MNRKLILGIFAGLVVLCTIASVAVGLWGTSLWQRVSEEPEGVRASVEAPSSVAQGESFVIRISVENLTGDAMVLDSVDIAEGYLAGIDILEADPAYSESFSLPFGGVQSYRFDQDIPANQTLIVRLTAQGKTTGEFSGAIDVCVDSGVHCLTFETRTNIEEP
jgi:kynurenine formamidase